MSGQLYSEERQATFAHVLAKIPCSGKRPSIVLWVIRHEEVCLWRCLESLEPVPSHVLDREQGPIDR